MICIISGTNRPGSRSLQVANLLKAEYVSLGAKVELIDLASLDFSTLNGSQYSENQPDSMKTNIELVNRADGLVVVCPEYNGSYPGILKYFIDHWAYPLSFEARPVCFVGLGGRFGGLRPVEHLQGVFGYRNAFLFPERVFISNVFKILEEGQIGDAAILSLIKKQAEGFIRFITGLKEQKLHTNNRPSQVP